MNRNPFTAKGELDLVGLLLTVIPAGLLSFLAARLFRQALKAAQIAEDVGRYQVWAAAWFLVAGVFFWIITTAFVKRWSEMRGEQLGPRGRAIIRAMLLSPLLSVWFLFFTLLHGTYGLFNAKESRKQMVILAIVTLLPFHLVMIGFGIVRGSKVHDHVVPYLSPLTKLAIRYYSDFNRANEIFEASTVGALDECPKSRIYLEIDVDDCFFQRFMEKNETKPFSTPAIGFYFEFRYREIVNRIPALSHIESLARMISTVSNMTTLMESGRAEGRREILRPLGLLPYLSSPELVVAEVGQTLQLIYLRRKMIPTMKQPIEQLERQIPWVEQTFSPTKAGEIIDVVAKLRSRVNKLQEVKTY